MRILVATITHRADDARIFAREIPALLDAGHQVTAIAPWRRSHVTPPPAVRAINVPRTHGRHRLWALVRGLVCIVRQAKGHDVILVHDPELAFTLAATPLRKKTIWDVHEDVPASLASKSWLPRPFRFLASRAVARIERWIERRMRLILAEERYTERFEKNHPVVLNLPRVPEALPQVEPLPQVVYVGSITRARGLDAMLRIAQQLQSHDISLLLIGEAPVDGERVTSAANVIWHGPMANSDALAEVERSLAGLSLLSDLPNYRHSMPTKVLEYMSRGVPVISTPLALAQAALGEHGVIVSFDPEKGAHEAVAEIVALQSDRQRRNQLRQAAFDRVSQNYNWLVHQSEFVSAVCGR